jgi:GntR family transcriptional regulator
MDHNAHPLDKTSPIPLYYQLAQRLQADIVAGVVNPGDLLGTEKAIQERYQVSRATVRKALEELARSGRLVRITGKGTFVAAPRVVVDAPDLLSFTEEMRRRGITPGASLIAFEDAACPPEVAEALQCAPGTTLRYIRRVRTGDGTPILVVDHYLPLQVPLAADDLHQSLYETIERSSGMRLQEAYHTVRAGLAEPDEAGLLGIEPGDPVLRFRRVTLAAAARPVVYEQGTARADLYEYSVHLLRR